MNRHTPLRSKMDPRRLWLLRVGWRAFAQSLAFTIFMVYQVARGLPASVEPAPVGEA